MSVTLERPAFYDAKRVNEWCGLSTDTKPLAATSGYKLFQGDIFIEIDTGSKYAYNAAGDTWVLQPSGGGGGGTDVNAVHYTADVGKTDAQKAQARENIGAGVPVTIVDNVTTTATDEALSANMGKALQDQVNNLKNIGRFLAIWDSSTGLPLTNPTTMPYTYRTGDYYRVGTVSSVTPAVNYKPNGATYDGTASTTVETESVEVGWVYYYDGTQWLAQSAGGGGTIQDVQINGTSILSSETGVANIPIAGANLGVMKAGSGLSINSTTGAVSINKASISAIEGKVEAYNPIVPANLDKAVMEGLGNNSLTWTDEYKSSARNTIGAITMEEYNSSASAYSENVLYYVVES